MKICPCLCTSKSLTPDVQGFIKYSEVSMHVACGRDDSTVSYKIFCPILWITSCLLIYQPSEGDVNIGHDSVIHQQRAASGGEVCL